VRGDPSQLGVVQLAVSAADLICREAFRLVPSAGHVGVERGIKAIFINRRPLSHMHEPLLKRKREGESLLLPRTAQPRNGLMRELAQQARQPLVCHSPKYPFTFCLGGGPFSVLTTGGFCRLGKTDGSSLIAWQKRLQVPPFVGKHATLGSSSIKKGRREVPKEMVGVKTKRASSSSSLCANDFADLHR